jgi:hypothetical protein
MALSANEIAIIIKAKDEASKVLKGVGKESGSLGSQLKVLAVAASAALASFASFKTLQSAISTTQALGSGINKLRRETGLTAEDSSKLAFAFRHFGLEATDASKSFGIFAKKLKGIEDAETGLTAGGKAAGAILKDIGVQAFTATGEIAPLSAIIPQVADVFRKMPDGMEKTALAMQLFGRSGKDMIPFLNQGSQGLKELGADAEKFGLVLSGEQLQKVKDYTYAQRDMGAALDGIKVQIGLAVMPALTKFTQFLTDQIPKIREFVASFGDEFSRIKGAIQPAIDKVTDFLDLFSRGDKITVAVAIIGTALVAAFIALGVAAASAAIGVIAATWPIIAITAAVVGLITAIVLIVKHWDDITAAVGRAREKFESLPLPIKILVVALATPLLPLIAIGVGVNQLVTRWSAAWDTIKNVTTAVINIILELAAKVLDTIAWVIGGLADIANKLPSWIPGASAVKDALNGMEGAARGAAAGLRDMKIAGDAALGAWERIAAAVWQGIEAQAEYSDDSTLLTNRLKNMKDAASRAASTFDPDLSGGGAGGAGDAFRGLDADLAALRQEMIATAEAGLAVLNSAIAGEEHVLAGLEVSLENAQTAHDELTKSIQDTTAAMNAWENAALKGSAAYSEALFAISQEQDALQLKINKITLGLMDQADAARRGVKGADSAYVSAALSAQVGNLARDLGIWDKGMQQGKLTAEQVERILAAARDRMTELGLEAQNINLTENLDIGAAQHELDNFFRDMGGYTEYTKEQIMAGWQASKLSLQDYLDLLATSDTYIADLTAAQKVHQGILEHLKKAADEISKALESGIDTAIKSAWEARGDTVVKSIEDAFAALDRGELGAAEAALANAQALFDTIKELAATPAEVSILANVDKAIQDATAAIEGTGTEIGANLAGGIVAGLVGGLSESDLAVAAWYNKRREELGLEALPEVQAAVAAWASGGRPPTEELLKIYRDTHTAVQTVSTDVQAVSTNILDLTDKVGDDLVRVGVVVQKSTGDILTTLKDSVVFYLETIRNRLDIINDTLVSIPSAQHGGAVLGGGLVAVHAGETIVPVGGRAGGSVNLSVTFTGPVMGDQRQADEFVRRMLPYLKRHVG